MRRVMIYAAAVLLWLPTLLYFALSGKVLKAYSWLNEKWKEVRDGR